MLTFALHLLGCFLSFSVSWVLFTVISCLCDCDFTGKWVLVSSELLTLNSRIHRRKQSQTQFHREWVIGGIGVITCMK